MKILKPEGLSVEQLRQEVKKGAKFVLFYYTVSLLVVTFKRPTDIYFIPAGESATSKGLAWTGLTAVAGWWGIPWGPIHSVSSIVNNSKGGKDVTKEVMNSLENHVAPVAIQ